MAELAGLKVYLSPEDLPAELRQHCRPVGRTGLYVFHHPFVTCPFPLAFPEPIETVIAEREARARERLAQGDFAGFLYRLERPYRLDGLCDLARQGVFDDDPAAYWTLARSVWTDSEIDEDEPVWREVLEAPIPQREAMTTEEDRAALAAMPGEIRIWRGVAAEDEGGAREACLAGFSWSLDRAVALKFARRGARAGGTAWYAEATIDRDLVIAYLRERGEEEILVDPREADPSGVRMIQA